MILLAHLGFASFPLAVQAVETDGSLEAEQTGRASFPLAVQAVETSFSLLGQSFSLLASFPLAVQAVETVYMGSTMVDERCLISFSRSGC